MKSTIRFTNTVNNEYQCKQLNLVHVPTGSKTAVEADTNATSGISLVVRDKAMLTLDTPKVEEDFTLTLHDISIVSSSGVAGNKASCFLQFGYPHAYQGFVFVFDPVTNPGQDLVLKRSGKNLIVTYAGSIVEVESNVVGPLVFMHLKNDVEGEDFEVFVSDIVYES
jgi:hypothetical protein